MTRLFPNSAGLLLFGLSALSGFGRDVAGEMPSLPRGFANARAASSAKERGLAGLDFTLRLNTLYDSNVAQQALDPESDWLITPAVQASYELVNSRWKLGARAGLEHDFYQKRDEFSATNYSLRAYGGYRSQKVVASFTSGISSTSGFNRLTSSFIEQFSYGSGLLASYHFTGKTSLFASWNQRTTESQTRGFGDTSSVTTGLSALWRMSPLLTVGPGFRNGTRTGVGDEEFTVMGPTLRLDYQLASKVKLRSSFGIDTADSPFSGEDTLLNWSAALTYRASSLWGFDLEMIRDSQASIAQGGGFDEVTSYRFNYWRKIRTARAQLGVSFEDRNPTDSQPTLVGVRDSKYLALSAALTFPVYQDQADLTLSVAWRDLSTTAGNSSWDGLQSGLGIQWRF